MKKTITILLLAATGLWNTGFAQQTNTGFVLNGKSEGEKEGLVYLSYANDKNENVKDSSVVKDGVFSFKGVVATPTMAYLQLKQNGRNNGTQFFLENANMTISLALGDLNKTVVTGSAMQREYEQMNKRKEAIRKETEPLSERYAKANTIFNEARKNKADDKTIDSLRYISAAIHDEFEPYNKRAAQMDYQFFAAHPQSIVTAYYLRFYVSSLPLDSLQQFYSGFGTKTQQSVYGKYIAEEIQKLQGGSPGSMAKNFTTTDINGNNLSLADYKGKYVLLDFWASWCVPCRKGNPHMKELYAKYKPSGNIEFIWVSDDDRDHIAWKKAVDQDGINAWKHVLRGLRFENGQYYKDKDISELFGVHTLPTTILVGPDGKIVGRYGESSADHAILDKKLETVFKS